MFISFLYFWCRGNLAIRVQGQPCWIAVVGPSGLEKRMATIHPTIRAAGEQIMPCFIFFKGLCLLFLSSFAYYSLHDLFITSFSQARAYILIRVLFITWSLYYFVFNKHAPCNTRAGKGKISKGEIDYLNSLKHIRWRFQASVFCY